MINKENKNKEHIPLPASFLSKVQLSTGPLEAKYRAPPSCPALLKKFVVNKQNLSSSPPSVILLYPLSLSLYLLSPISSLLSISLHLITSLSPLLIIKKEQL